MTPQKSAVRQLSESWPGKGLMDLSPFIDIGDGSRPPKVAVGESMTHDRLTRGNFQMYGILRLGQRKSSHSVCEPSSWLGNYCSGTSPLLT